MAEAQWISVADAARVLDKSERTIRRQCESGKLRARQESTATGKAWMICLNPADDVTEGLTEAVTEAVTEGITEGEIEEAPANAAATSVDDNDAAAIVSTLEIAVSTPPAIAPANNEVLAQVSELRHDVEQIKAYLTGQIVAEVSDKLATLPTRDDIREDFTSAMTAAISPVMQRLESLAAENAQLQTALQAEKQKALAQAQAQARRPWWKKMFS